MSAPLLIDRTSGGRSLLSAKGRPVWPVRSEDELSSLVEIARIFNTPIEFIHGEVERVNFSSKEEVCGLGPEIEEATQLYAHLTQRHTRIVKNLDQLCESNLPDVLVTTSSHLTFELLDRLYPLGGSSPTPGIICAKDPTQLRRQVLVRSAAANLQGPVTIPRIDLLPPIPVDHLLLTDRIVLGRNASAQEIRDALGSGSGILHILTHSDGIDAFLGPLTLCPIDQPPENADGASSPLCQLTGICHRHDVPVQQAQQLDILVPPEAIAARVLVCQTCWGVLSQNPIINHAWGIGTRLFESPKLGVIITTWGVIIPSRWNLEKMFSDLLQGQPVGQALGSFLRSPVGQQSGIRMCLMGDPRVRLPKLNTVTHREHVMHILPRPAEVAATDDPKEIAFFRAYLKAQIPGQPNQLSEPAQRLLSTIESYGIDVRRGALSDDIHDSASQNLRREVLHYMLRRGGLPVHDWIKLAEQPQVIDSHSSCYICGLRTQVFKACLHIVGMPQRRLTICQRCGLIEDAPLLALPMKISISNKYTVRLDGNYPREKCVVGLLLEYDLKSLTKWWEWPLGPDNAPMEEFTTPAPWPPGPVDVVVFVVWEGNFAVMARQARSS